MKKIIYISGITASILYVVAVIIGGLLWPNYSHLKQAISELSMVGSPVLHQVGWMFSLYNYLLLIFGIGQSIIWWRKNKLLMMNGIFLSICALAGIGMLYATQDPIGAALTKKGLIHLVLAGVASITTLLAVFFAAFGFGKEKKYDLKTISLIFGIIIFISGPITAIAITKIPAFFGLIERVTIGAFILWLLIISGRLFIAEIKGEK